jgi:hypothetical protein
MNLLQELVLQIERKKMLKALDWTDDGTVYEGEIEALFQTLKPILKQPGSSKTDVGV